MAKSHTSIVSSKLNTGGGISIGITNDPAFHVGMNFDRPAPGMIFTPDQAQQIGVTLIEMACQARVLAKQPIPFSTSTKTRTH